MNGPNLNLTGRREQEKYGNHQFEQILEKLYVRFPEVEFEYFQSNIEGELINKLHEWGFSLDGIILNAGGYTHTSVAIGDAVKAISTPVVEVHISNVMQREEFRHVSFISPNAKGVISGFGAESYTLAVNAFLNETI
jgi:3-dehydroquinate dehydratase-2